MIKGYYDGTYFNFTYRLYYSVQSLRHCGLGNCFTKWIFVNTEAAILGGTNTFRVLGKKAGLIVTTLDILKGTAATFLPTSSTISTDSTSTRSFLA